MTEDKGTNWEIRLVVLCCSLLRGHAVRILIVVVAVHGGAWLQCLPVRCVDNALDDRTRRVL